MVPELDLSRVRRWAVAITPPELRERTRVEVDETDDGLIIMDCLHPWPDDPPGTEWSRVPVARLAYSEQTGEWTLYFTNRTDQFFLYPEFEPSRHVNDLLEQIDDDPGNLFRW